jgi:hypothetical protein
MPTVDVVVVSYNSSSVLESCVSPFGGDDRFDVIVVDNASQDGSVAAVSGLPVRMLELERNYGFAFGCNRGWQAGSSPFVLFLNPDARAEPDTVLQLAAVLGSQPKVGAVGPRILEEDGTLDLSQRRFPRLRSTYAQALFLHRLFPKATWVDEVVHDVALYGESRVVEWISGACLLVRRDALERIGGWDEGFFLYSEDKDICRRLWDAGYEIRYEATATVVHAGGQSAPRSGLLPTLAASRIRYARKHHGTAVAMLERIGIAFGDATHAALTTKGRAARAGHLRAVRVAVRPQRPAR